MIARSASPRSSAMRPPSTLLGAERAEHEIGIGHGRRGAAAPVAGRVRARRQRCCGPTFIRPSRPIQAMVPPPAPSVCTASIGVPTSWPAMRPLEVSPAARRRSR